MKLHQCQVHWGSGKKRTRMLGQLGWRFGLNSIETFLTAAGSEKIYCDRRRLIMGTFFEKGFWWSFRYSFCNSGKSDLYLHRHHSNDVQVQGTGTTHNTTYRHEVLRQPTTLRLHNNVTIQRFEKGWFNPKILALELELKICVLAPEQQLSKGVIFIYVVKCGRCFYF